MKASVFTRFWTIPLWFFLCPAVSCRHGESLSDTSFPQERVFDEPVALLKFKGLPSFPVPAFPSRPFGLFLAGDVAGNDEVGTLDLLAFSTPSGGSSFPAASNSFAVDTDFLYFAQGVSGEKRGEILLDVDASSCGGQTLLLLANARKQLDLLLAAPPNERRQLLDELVPGIRQLVPPLSLNKLADKYGIAGKTENDSASFTVKLSLCKSGIGLVPKDWDEIHIGADLQ